MAADKSLNSQQSPDAFLAQVEPAKRRADARTLLTFFQEVTGFEPVMWRGSMIGYGRYHYIYDSGREGDFLATGFSPRKANLSIYVMPGYSDYNKILSRLGKHRTGKSCLYVNTLDDIDMDVLAELIRAGLKDLNTRWQVHPV